MPALSLCGGIMPQVDGVGKRILAGRREGRVLQGSAGSAGFCQHYWQRRSIPVLSRSIRCPGQQQCPWDGTPSRRGQPRICRYPWWPQSGHFSEVRAPALFLHW